MPCVTIEPHETAGVQASRRRKRRKKLTRMALSPVGTKTHSGWKAQDHAGPVPGWPAEENYQGLEVQRQCKKDFRSLDLRLHDVGSVLVTSGGRGARCLRLGRAVPCQQRAYAKSAQPGPIAGKLPWALADEAGPSLARDGKTRKPAGNGRDQTHVSSKKFAKVQHFLLCEG